MGVGAARLAGLGADHVDLARAAAARRGEQPHQEGHPGRVHAHPSPARTTRISGACGETSSASSTPSAVAIDQRVSRTRVRAARLDLRQRRLADARRGGELRQRQARARPMAVQVVGDHAGEVARRAARLVHCSNVSGRCVRFRDHLVRQAITPMAVASRRSRIAFSALAADGGLAREGARALGPGVRRLGAARRPGRRRRGRRRRRLGGRGPPSPMKRGTSRSASRSRLFCRAG